MSILNRNDAFTIIWKIHNFSMCPDVSNASYTLSSPSITIDMFDKTDWRLILSSKNTEGDNCLSCELYRETKQNVPPSINISFSTELVSIDSSKVTSKIFHKVFNEEDGIEQSLGKLDEIYTKKDILLPSDILTIQCCMWESDERNLSKITAGEKVAVEDPKSNGCQETTSVDNKIQEQKILISHVYVQNVAELNPMLSRHMYLSAEELLNSARKKQLPNKCVVRTQIELERRCIPWAIDKFSKIKLGQRIFLPLISARQETFLILALYMFEDVEGDSDLRIDIQRDQSDVPVFVKCAITILDAQREDRSCVEDTRLLDSDDTDSWHLTLAKKNKLLGEGQYLKNDTLFLRCEFTLSWYERNFTVETIVSYPEMHRVAEISDSDDWKKELVRIREQGDFCDIILQIGQQSFCAHKVVLCASSTYFRDMFSGDFKEQKVEITDCEPGTLDKLLKYMYSGVLEKMLLEDLMKLYSVANNLQVVGLKKLCSCELRFSLEMSNVCQMLNFADIHKDQVLKTSVGKFIAEYATEVFHSSKWKDLMECNPKLTGNVMHEVLTNNIL